jgi:8-oxo-dGTP pyrophosphatase MutT (NUDIX family)
MKHIAVTILILPDKQVVLQRRDFNTQVSPGLLGLFGGSVEGEESFFQAACRELKEETSLAVDELNISSLGEIEIPSSQGKPEPRMFHVFLANLESSNFEVYEGVGLEVFDLENVLDRIDLAPSARVILEKIRSDEWHLV